MRSFTCYDCGHQFQVPHGVGGPGAQMACPNCGSRNIHRAQTDRGFARAARGQQAHRVGGGRQGPARVPRWGR